MNNDLRVLGLQHIGIPCNNLNLTTQFFESIGFETVLRTQTAHERVAFMRLENITLEIYENGNAANTAGAIDHLALSVENIEEYYELILAKGYVPIEGKICFLPFWQNGVRYFTILGPEQEKVEFSQIL